MKVKHVIAAAVFCFATAGGARADDLHFNSSVGPMDIRFGPGGEVYGRYRQIGGAQRPGRLDGAVSAGGILGGYWLQPESDHPCSYARKGTHAWGHFTITNAWSASPYGVWGYCDENPNRSWELQRR